MGKIASKNTINELINIINSKFNLLDNIDTRLSTLENKLYFGEIPVQSLQTFSLLNDIDDNISFLNNDILYEIIDLDDSKTIDTTECEVPDDYKEIFNDITNDIDDNIIPIAISYYEYLQMSEVS